MYEVKHKEANHKEAKHLSVSPNANPLVGVHIWEPQAGRATEESM